MKGIIALVLLQIAAAAVGLACWVAYGDPWAAVCVPLGILSAIVWRYAARADDAARWRAFQEGVEKILTAPSEQDAFRRDVVAVAYGEMEEEEFDRKWAGRVPASPRPPRQKDRRIELFKEIMTDPQYASEAKDVRDKIAAEIMKELGRPDARPSWTCKITLGLHDDGPCQCIELASGPSVVSGPSALYRADQYVRYKERIWYVDRAVLCHGPQDMKWWAYYISREQEQLHPDEKDLTLALPRQGEWWEYSKSCNTHHHAWDDPRCRPFQVTAVDSHLCMDDYVQCGCLRPVNYGVGFPPQSFDLTKAPQVPGTGITYIMGTPKKEQS